MNYHSLLELCGAKVIAFETFGDYQGTWIAKVKYNDKIGYVEGSYGSCSGCDSLQDILMNHNSTGDTYHWFEPENTNCNSCVEIEQLLKNMSIVYLEGLEDFQTTISRHIENSEWDLESENIVKWMHEQQNDGVEK